MKRTASPKYFDGTDKIVDDYSLKFDTTVDGWVMCRGTKFTGDNYITTGSQIRGTQLIKVYKSVDTAKKAFAKTHDKDNQSKYVRHYAVLTVQGAQK